MKNIPDQSHVFLDTNIILYALAGHPRFGRWCNTFLDRVHRGDVTGYISGVVLNELIHKLVIGEVAESGAGKVVPCDADRFADIMPELLDNPEATRRMGEKGKALVKERYQCSKVAAAMEDAYRSIISLTSVS